MRRAIVNGLVWFILVFVVLGFLFLPFGLTMAGQPTGKDIYDKKCAICHGADGVAKPMWAKEGAKNFNDPAWLKSVSDETMTKAIADGVPGKKMPAYKDKLTPEEIAGVVKHIRSLAPSK